MKYILLFLLLCSCSDNNHINVIVSYKHGNCHVIDGSYGSQNLSHVADVCNVSNITINYFVKEHCVINPESKMGIYTYTCYGVKL